MSLHSSHQPHQLCNWFPMQQGAVMVPQVFVQFMFFGAAVIFAVIVIGTLVVLDRTRLPLITRARDSNEPTVQDLFIQAQSQYED